MFLPPPVTLDMPTSCLYCGVNYFVLGSFFFGADYENEYETKANLNYNMYNTHYSCPVCRPLLLGIVISSKFIAWKRHTQMFLSGCLNS